MFAVSWIRWRCYRDIDSGLGVGEMKIVTVELHLFLVGGNVE